MTPAEVVLSVITEQCGGLKGEVALKNRLTDRLFIELNLDSLDIVEMVMDIEDKLNLDIDTNDAAFAKIATVQDFINYTEARVKGEKR